jgi:hypothetical protein
MKAIVANCVKISNNICLGSQKYYIYSSITDMVFLKTNIANVFSASDGFIFTTADTTPLG